jgi:hypothetical protein
VLSQNSGQGYRKPAQYLDKATEGPSGDYQRQIGITFFLLNYLSSRYCGQLLGSGNAISQRYFRICLIYAFLDAVCMFAD